jgi:hypothetical protein
MASIFDNSKSSTHVHASNWDKLLHALDAEALSSAATKAGNARSKFDAVSGVVAVNKRPVAEERDMDLVDAAIQGMEAAEKEMSATLTRCGNPLTPEKAKDVARMRGAAEDPKVVITLVLDPNDSVVSNILREEAQRMTLACATLGIPVEVVNAERIIH